MSGILKIEIVESIETLSSWLKPEKNLKKKERIQILYWLKTRLAKTVGDLSSLSGKQRTTVSKWLSLYREGGLSKILDIGSSSGRKPAIPPDIQKALINELNNPEGFSSYKEIQTWIRSPEK